MLDLQNTCYLGLTDVSKEALLPFLHHQQAFYLQFGEPPALKNTRNNIASLITRFEKACERLQDRDPLLPVLETVETRPNIPISQSISEDNQTTHLSEVLNSITATQPQTIFATSIITQASRMFAEEYESVTSGKLQPHLGRLTEGIKLMNTIKRDLTPRWGGDPRDRF